MADTGRLRWVRKSHRGVRVLVLVIALAALCAVSIGGLWASAVEALPDPSYSEEELKFVWLLNEYRASKGVQPLLLSDPLALSAARHSSDMGNHGFFSHRTGYNTAMTQPLPGTRSCWFPTGYYPWERMRFCGYTYYTSMGENIGAGQRTAQEVFDAFRLSTQGHNEAMLASYYKVVGVARESVGSVPYWTIDFGGYVDPSAREGGLYQETDRRITYLGSWSTRWAASASGGSFYYTSAAGAAALVSFTGTSMKVYAKKGPVYGIVEISMDGGTPTTVDLYSATDAFKQPVYTWTGPSEASPGVPHTLTIRCTGTKNEASGGCVVDLDAIEVTAGTGMPGTLTQAPAPIRHQQEDPAFKYTGTWTTSPTDWSASGGSYVSTNSPGAAVNVTFDGTYVAWIAKKGPGYGRAAVSLDGGEPVMVDLYSPYNRYKQKVYETGLLEDKEHTLTIYWVGQKSTTALDYRIDVDTFDMFGEALAASDAGPLTWLYQQNDRRITYVGPWSTRWAGPASEGSFLYTSTTGAGAVVGFAGTSVEVFAKKGPVYGIVEISVDGGTPTTVDLYSAADLFQESIYISDPLTDGPHTLTIRCTGTKNLASGGCVVDVDALEITGAMTQAPTLTRVQQDNTIFAPPYDDTWSTGWTWSASGGSFVSTSIKGSEVTITFDGFYLSWIARSTPWYGIAEVSLDGGKAIDVDLYSSSIIWKKPVYNTGLLSAGTHTLVIKCTDAKNPRSVGFGISVDAADMILTPR